MKKFTGSSRREEAHTSLGRNEPPYVGCYERKTLATQRAKLARESLANCHLCAHHCGANRITGERGPCHAGIEARIFSAQIEVSDELELIPTFAIAFSGCDLRCDFCITGKDSWNVRAGELLDVEALALKASIALNNGARTIMILGGEPTIHLPSVLEVVSHLPNEAKLIWKTNAHGSALAHDFLDGLFDVWLVDYKFGNNECAQRLARVENYRAMVEENLVRANEHSELIIRHLVMPGHVECCWRPVAAWIASNVPATKVNLRSGFWPAWHAMRHVELRETTSLIEADCATDIAREYGLNLVE